jgi:hypothetical protein
MCRHHAHIQHQKNGKLGCCVNPKNMHGLLDFSASILHMDPQTTDEQNGKIIEYAWQLQETES